jgi:hypothetical protein
MLLLLFESEFVTYYDNSGVFRLINQPPLAVDPIVIHIFISSSTKIKFNKNSLLVVFLSINRKKQKASCFLF